MNYLKTAFILTNKNWVIFSCILSIKKNINILFCIKIKFPKLELESCEIGRYHPKSDRMPPRTNVSVWIREEVSENVLYVVVRNLTKLLGIRPICSAHLHRTFFRIDLVSVCLSGIMEGVLSPTLFFWDFFNSWWIFFVFWEYYPLSKLAVFRVRFVLSTLSCVLLVRGTESSLHVCIILSLKL